MDEKEKDGWQQEEMSGPSEGVEEESKNELPTEKEAEEESPDKLLRALEEIEEETASKEATGRNSSSKTTILLLMGLLLSIAGIGAGGFVLWNLLRSPPSPKIGGLPVFPKASKPSTPSQKPMRIGPLKPVLEYSLILKHFLIPLQSEGGAPVFVKATVILYFENQKQVLLAKKLETPIRGIIFDTFKNIPFYYWRSKEGTQKVREALLETLKKKAPEGLYPQDLEVTGYILK